MRLDCVDLDEALEVASKNPGATFGILELRPFVESSRDDGDLSRGPHHWQPPQGATGSGGRA